MEEMLRTTGEKSLDKWSNYSLGCILQSIKDSKPKTELLSCRDNNGSTPLHQIRNYYLLNHIFQDIDENDRCKLLTVQDRYGRPPLHNLTCIDMLNEFVSQSMFLKVASIKDYSGLPVFHSLATNAWEPFMARLVRIRQAYVLSADMLCMKYGTGVNSIQVAPSHLTSTSPVRQKGGG